jgi:hypothetical protein
MAIFAFHVMFHEAAARRWDEEELRRLAQRWSEASDDPQEHRMT